MKKLLYIICICLTAISCHRRELTYDYSPYCEVMVNVDWSNMSTPPTGMSIRAYPQSGEAPIVIESNTITHGVLKLPAGVYNILVFNQIPSDYGTVSFRGLDKWETTEVYSVENTKAPWAQALSKGDNLLVREPETVAAATYKDVEIREECIIKSTQLFKESGKRVLAHTINVKPNIVVKRTHIRVKVDGIYNLRSTTAVFTGMSNGYNFAKQQSLQEQASHIVDEWTIKDFAFGERFGETNAYFLSFGLPSVTTTTRPAADWRGSINLQMLLVDNETVIEHVADVTSYTTVKDEESSKADPDFDVDVETSITVQIGLSGNTDDPMPVLPDVKPAGGSSGGFDATIDDWEDEQIHDVVI